MRRSCNFVRQVAKKLTCTFNEFQMPTNYRRVGINHVMSRRLRPRVGMVLFKAVPRMHNDGLVMCRWWDANVANAAPRVSLLLTHAARPALFHASQPSRRN